jgi:hypothetical protein
METSECKEYDAKRNIKRLDPSNPRALNFAEEQSMKSFISHAAGTTYTIAPLESLGDTAYVPPDDEVDSQETDLFELDEDDYFVEHLHNDEGGIIDNMEAVVGETPHKMAEKAAEKDVDMDDVDAEGDQGGADCTISSPEKINRMTTNFDEITNVPSEGQRDIIYGMSREWAGTRGDKDLPPPLQALADQIGVATVVQEPNTLTPA